MKRTLISLALFTAISTSAVASTNSWENEAKDAWIDGKAEATLLFNGTLNPFDIDTDVELGSVTLSGSVENEVEKQLAEELISGIEGVTSVNNNLTISKIEMDDDSDDISDFTDAKIEAVVATRLLFDTNVSSWDIEVEVDNGIVTLEGEVESQAERDLAVTIAENINDVKSVNDDLRIEIDAE